MSTQSSKCIHSQRYRISFHETEMESLNKLNDTDVTHEAGRNTTTTKTSRTGISPKKVTYLLIPFSFLHKVKTVKYV